MASTHNLPEGPVVCGIGIGGESPIPQHCPRHHCVLHLLHNVPQHLVGRLGTSGLQGERQCSFRTQCIIMSKKL